MMSIYTWMKRLLVFVHLKSRVSPSWVIRGELRSCVNEWKSDKQKTISDRNMQQDEQTTVAKS